MFTELSPEASVSQSCCTPPLRTPQELEEIVVYARLALYNHDMPCGPRALRKHLKEIPHVRPLPSERAIAKMLARNGLSHGRTGWYPGESPKSAIRKSKVPTEPKGDKR